MAKRLLATPGQDEIKAEYGKGATVLTNARIIRQLGLLATKPKGEKTP